MDNAAFHKSAKTRELIEKFGCYLLFLPSYSPDLSPIEHWHGAENQVFPIVVYARLLLWAAQGHLMKIKSRTTILHPFSVRLERRL